MHKFTLVELLSSANALRRDNVSFGGASSTFSKKLSISIVPTFYSKCDNSILRYINCDNNCDNMHVSEVFSNWTDTVHTFQLYSFLKFTIQIMFHTDGLIERV